MSKTTLSRVDRLAQDHGVIIERVSGLWFWRPAENIEYDYSPGSGSVTKSDAWLAYCEYQADVIACEGEMFS